jgi:anti-anti-sigma regulatory factor
MPSTALKFARTDAGYCLRIEGKGTMVQSRPAETFIGEALAIGESIVVLDLSGCTYLDSTFLGCLLGLNRRFGAQRLRISAPTELTRKLFGPTRLDMVLHVTTDLPDPIGEFVEITSDAKDSTDMARHIMECHRRLADIPGPQQVAFAAIAQQMARELETRTGVAGK